MCLFVFGKEEIVQRKVQVKAQQQKVKNKREQKYNYSLKRKTMGAGCELKIEEVMCFTKVSPMGLPAQPPPPPDRPSPVVRKSISRNLWGSPAKGETDAILAAQQEKQKTYVKERFNIDLEEIDKLPISALIKSEGAKDLFLPNPRLQGVKRKFSQSPTSQPPDFCPSVIIYFRSNPRLIFLEQTSLVDDAFALLFFCFPLSFFLFNPFELLTCILSHLHFSFRCSAP